MRGLWPLDFTNDGFEVLEFNLKLKYNDFNVEKAVKDTFLLEIANTFKSLRKAQHVQIFEHTIRKQHEMFPISTVLPYGYNQPTSMAHVDTTVRWAWDMAQQLNTESAKEFIKYRIQCVK